MSRPRGACWRGGSTGSQMLRAPQVRHIHYFSQFQFVNHEPQVRRQWGRLLAAVTCTPCS
jgi:hypothetical protein